MKLSCMAVRSLLILLLVNPVAAGFEFDTTTRGNWQTRYGADGYYVHQGPQKHAGAFEVNGAPWIWTAATADESAVASLDGQSRIASCWYSSATFVVTAGIEDGVERQVAFYFLDWDANGRVQKIERLDPVTGAVLDETTLRDFQFGTYLTVNATGLVRLRITPLAGANAVLSGVFLGAPLPPLQQVATLLISPQGGQYSAPVNVLLSTETDGAEIYYTTDGRDPAVVGIRYLGPFTMTRAGYVRVIGRMEGFADSDEAGALFTFEGPATAVDFLGFDWQTMGSWIGNVGNAGYFLTMFAPVASGTAIDHNATPRWVWLWSTDDPATLQKPPAANSADRYAACWYDLDVLSFRLDLREARALILSVYALDYDSGGRIQQFDLLNPATGELIDSQSVERFHDGVYLKWRISSSVVLRVSRLAGPNAVVSGIFLDPSDGNFVALPQFTPPGGTYNEVVDVSIASATDGAQIRYTTDGSVPTESAILYTEPFRISQSITLTARAFKDGMAPSGLKTAAFTILGSPAATPQFTPPGGTYSGVVDVSIASATDGAQIRYTTDGSIPTEISDLYTEPFRISESITLTARAFKDGMVPSGLRTAAFTITGEPVAEAQFVGIDSTTQGNWRGAEYGGWGGALFGDYIWMTVDDHWGLNFTTPPGLSWAEHTWAYNVTDPAALQMHRNPEQRLAACRYAEDTFTIEIQPGLVWNSVTAEMSLYFLDWDYANRFQKVEVIDLETGFVLDVRLVDNFARGLYYSWHVRGPIGFRITAISGPNAVVSGIFITPPNVSGFAVHPDSLP